MAHSRLWTDGKLKRLIRQVGEIEPHVVGHLDCLWNSAYEHCPPSGRIDPKDVEACAEWDGKKGAFLRALFDTGFIERKRSAVYLHKFRSNAPDYVRKRWASRGLYKRRIPENSGKRPENSGQIAPTQPNPTQPNKRARPPTPRQAAAKARRTLEGKK